MHFPDPLIPARLIRRYKRFLADVVLEDGRQITAHCPNPGAMLGCAEEGARIWLSPVHNPKARLRWRWELVESHDTLIGINTMLANRIVAEAIKKGQIAPLAGYGSLKSEVSTGAGTRFDFMASDHPERPGEPCYIEVKSVTYRRDGLAQFPDSVTQRGARHLLALKAMLDSGARAMMIYLIQRSDCSEMTFACDIDQIYYHAYEEAVEAGIESYAYGCHLSPSAIEIDQPLPIGKPALYAGP
ncbi:MULTISPECIES: DNA/RNA nuclease SfsA [unclassified Iodidimonas]|jgi:sugar fermentation stimulation protein A|uniref:DNA/RNA nuclease SfsA n=1 Tax=unclassified Iodidimonas TaxID=2626145 RepID=UPI002482DBB9|nr:MULTISPECIES: DNA/RNA nuclease SfsA [unclassified Iodidimonas]